MSIPYRQCVRCVMDTSDPDIQFDAEGRCNHCTVFAQRRARVIGGNAINSHELDRIVDGIRASGRGHDYDCVIGVSGGVDSSFLAYHVKSLGLRPLAVHLDNGWNSNASVRNIRNVLDALRIDYQSLVLDWEEFRDLQLAFFKASVPEIETPTDIAISAALHKVASEHGVRFIVSGSNQATEAILPAAWHYDAKDERYLRAIHRQFGQRPLRTFPTFGYAREAYYKLVRGIRMFYMLDYLPYSRESAVRELESKLSWQNYGGKHHESKITAFVQSYVLPTKFGMDYRRATRSVQICMGEVTREQALEELKQPPYDPSTVAADKEYVAKKFDISVEEFDAILARPPRTHHDYPNDERKLAVLYDAYRRVISPWRRLSVG